MPEPTAANPAEPATSAAPQAVPQAVAVPGAGGPRSFAFHAKVIGLITLGSRLLGLAREVVASRFFGAGPAWSAFVFAFTVPNLFRKLLGEGALSAAFIPLYARSLKEDNPPEAAAFANASVNLLGVILLAITLVGEAGLIAAVLLFELRPDHLLGLKLTIVMLPYVMLVCGTAFLSAILQVHDRFGVPAATAVVSNLCLIAAMLLAAWRMDLSTEAARERAVYWLGVSVLVAGVLQIAMLVPGLKACGYRFRLTAFWTPRVQRMLMMSIPVALGAGVLQLGVLLDKGISFFLAAAPGATHFTLLGQSISYPLYEGAAARLNWAQFMYQFPLGVFAIAIATAIFPRLSRESALVNAQVSDDFKTTLRQGVEAALFVGLPASVGLVLVAEPAVRFMFEGGRFTPFDTEWTARSTALYSAAIWAFSLQQILNRAYYALHDMTTPLVWAVINLMANLAIEIPLLWTPMRESGMAVATLAVFSVQSAAMLWLLDRRLGGIGLRQALGPIGKMVLASGVMAGVLLAMRQLPVWPDEATRHGSAIALLVLMVLGGLTYAAACYALRVEAMRQVVPNRWRRRA